MYLILLNLSENGYRVLIFPEWRKSKELKYNIEMRKYNNLEVIYNAHRILPKIKTKIFLSSTASKHFYFSKCIKRFFYFHSIAGLDGFPKGGLDDYTDFLCASKQQYQELQKRFRLQNKQKNLHKVGYPKLDKLINKLKEKNSFRQKNKLEKKNNIILIAPSFASDSIYKEISLLPKIREIVFFLIKQNYKVILRPHPVSLRRGRFVSELKILENLKIRNFEFDKSQDYFETYLKSDLMLTDVSGTSMIYRIAFNKPVIFLNENKKKAKKALRIIDKLGPIVTKIDKLNKAIENYNIKKYDKIDDIYNLGNSSQKILALLKK